MATPQTITLNNIASLMRVSTQGRAGTPDGNIYFNRATDRIELITVEDGLTQVDLGSGLEANPFTNFFGITFQAISKIETELRAIPGSPDRGFLKGTLSVYKFAGAWQLRNGVKFADGDRSKVRSSGWSEFAANGSLDRVYFNPKSLNAIDPASQPYVQFVLSLSEANRQAAAPINASRLGDLDEAFQVYGSTANGDTGAGDFDFRSRNLIVSVRTFGRTQGSATSVETDIPELDAFSAGFGLGELPSPTAAFNINDVFGGAAALPFSTMTFERLTTPQVETGFNEVDGSFTDIIANPNGGTLAQVRAYLDALMQQDTDQDIGAGSFIPKRAEPLYTVNNEGKLVFRQGLFPEGIPAADQQNIILIDDAGNQKTYIFLIDVRIRVSDVWVSDPNAWFTCHLSAGHDTAGATLLQDSAGNGVEGTEADVVGGPGNYEIRFTVTYTADTNVIFKAGGDGIAKEASVPFTIVEQAIVNASALSEQETNF